MARSIYGCSVKGAAHEKNGMPCQDSFHINRNLNDISIVAIADGHGSEKSPKSDRGSAIAVESFNYVMGQYLKSYSRDLGKLVTYLNRDGQIKFAQDICKTWQNRVRREYRSLGEERILNEKGRIDWPEVFRLYGTTLLGLLVTKTFVFAFQIGDGDMVLIDKDNISPVVESEKFLGTETHSLSKENAWKRAASSIQKRPETKGKPYLYMLSTDGFINSHASQEDYEKTCREYFQMIVEHGFDKVSSNLENWLRETSDLGCGDDITVVLLYVD